MEKEKYERICAIKNRALSLLEMGINQDVSAINSKEIYELMDIVKDSEEAIKYAEEACYYHKITEAMEKNKDPENAYYMNKYAPETMRYYTPGMGPNRGGMNGGRSGTNGNGGRSDGRCYEEMYYPIPWEEYDDRYDKTHTKMYYTPMMHKPEWDNDYPREMNPPHDPREGRAYVSRRGYMEAKEHGDKNEKAKELDQFMNDMAADMTEMINGMEPNEKQALKARLTQMANKIV